MKFESSMQSRHIRRKLRRYKIREIKPLDFIEKAGGVPISFFHIQKGPAGIAGQMQDLKPGEADQEKRALSQLRVLESVLSVGLLKMGRKNADHEWVILKYPRDALFIFEEILKLSIWNFKVVMKVSRQYVEHLDELARCYGQTPIDILLPNGGYSDIEAYIFNQHVQNVGTISKNDRMRSEAARAKAMKYG
jgi:hypothetical protein